MGTREVAIRVVGIRPATGGWNVGTAHCTRLRYVINSQLKILRLIPK